MYNWPIPPSKAFTKQGLNNMKSTFNEYTMNKVALFSNGLQVIEQHGRFLLCKEYKGEYKVFLNTASFDYAIQYGQKM